MDMLTRNIICLVPADTKRVTLLPLMKKTFDCPCDHCHTLMAVEWLPIWDGIKYQQIKVEIIYIIYCIEDVTYVDKMLW
jgi:hypothetical protein